MKKFARPQILFFYADEVLFSQIQTNNGCHLSNPNTQNPQNSF
jgi:hypothetical protein